MTVGYVLRMFPQTSETFIVNEILELERRGADVRIYSYRKPRARAPHASVRRIRAPVTYLPDPLARHPGKLLGAQLSALRRDRSRYRLALASAVGQCGRQRSPDALRRLLQAACLADHARRDGVTHLHAHFSHEATRVAMLAAQLTGLPYSFTAHARDIYSHDVDFRLLREKAEAARFVVTVSRYNRDYMAVRIGAAAASRVHVVYNGIDLTAFSPDPALEREDDLIVGVGRLVEKKGFSTLIEACRLLHARGRPFRCEIVGEGELRAQLEGEIRAAGLGGVVRLAGGRSQEELPDLYRRATVLAMPAVIGADGNRDALPTVLLEALACGLPVVASRLTGIAEIVDAGRNGLLVTPGDADELSRALEAILADRDLRRRFGVDGRAKAVRRFDLRASGEALHVLLDPGARSPMTEASTDALRVPVV